MIVCGVVSWLSLAGNSPLLLLGLSLVITNWAFALAGGVLLLLVLIYVVISEGVPLNLDMKYLRGVLV